MTYIRGTLGCEVHNMYDNGFQLIDHLYFYTFRVCMYVTILPKINNEICVSKNEFIRKSLLSKKNINNLYCNVQTN